VLLYRSAPLQLLTKGDNNAADDTELYARGQNFLNREKDVVGEDGYARIHGTHGGVTAGVILVFCHCTVARSMAQRSLRLLDLAQRAFAM
jgi:hypothetical protein